MISQSDKTVSCNCDMMTLWFCATVLTWGSFSMHVGYVYGPYLFTDRDICWRPNWLHWPLDVDLIQPLYAPLRQHFKYRFCPSNEALADPALLCIFDYSWCIYHVWSCIKLYLGSLLFQIVVYLQSELQSCIMWRVLASYQHCSDIVLVNLRCSFVVLPSKPLFEGLVGVSFSSWSKTERTLDFLYLDHNSTLCNWFVECGT